MFCPRCGAQNKPEQKFCRNCGLSLPSVRMALEGKVEEAAAELKQGYENLGGGVGVMGIFILIAAINVFFWEWGALINLVLGFLITVRWIRKGFKQMERAMETLEGKEERQEARPAQSALQAEPAAQSELSLPPVPDTDPILSPPAPNSVAEHTTFELKQPEPRQ